MPIPPPAIKLYPASRPSSTMAMNPQSLVKTSMSLSGGMAKATLNLRGRYVLP